MQGGMTDFKNKNGEDIAIICLLKEIQVCHLFKINILTESWHPNIIGQVSYLLCYI